MDFFSGRHRRPLQGFFFARPFFFRRDFLPASFDYSPIWRVDCASGPSFAFRLHVCGSWEVALMLRGFSHVSFILCQWGGASRSPLYVRGVLSVLVLFTTINITAAVHAGIWSAPLQNGSHEPKEATPCRKTEESMAPTENRGAQWQRQTVTSVVEQQTVIVNGRLVALSGASQLTLVEDAVDKALSGRSSENASGQAKKFFSSHYGIGIFPFGVVHSGSYLVGFANPGTATGNQLDNARSFEKLGNSWQTRESDDCGGGR
jgi:hypothetical protein